MKMRSEMRSGMKETEQAVSRPGRYHAVAENLRVKEVHVGDGGSRT
jgi:hypothetical protein